MGTEIEGDEGVQGIPPGLQHPMEQELPSSSVWWDTASAAEIVGMYKQQIQEAVTMLLRVEDRLPVELLQDVEDTCVGWGDELRENASLLQLDTLDKEHSLDKEYAINDMQECLTLLKKLREIIAQRQAATTTNSPQVDEGCPCITQGPTCSCLINDAILEQGLPETDGRTDEILCSCRGQERLNDRPKRQDLQRINMGRMERGQVPAGMTAEVFVSCDMVDKGLSCSQTQDRTDEHHLRAAGSRKVAMTNTRQLPSRPVLQTSSLRMACNRPIGEAALSIKREAGHRRRLHKFTPGRGYASSVLGGKARQSQHKGTRGVMTPHLQMRGCACLLSQQVTVSRGWKLLSPVAALWVARVCGVLEKLMVQMDILAGGRLPLAYYALTYGLDRSQIVSLTYMSLEYVKGTRAQLKLH
ncbi:hypothetical protein CBR_g19799 [Chara braunii]|uniref:Uncharacterized protein n=1 Tax=Chara braunii TaxID=69332 RepID=A0A388JU20_CHABU|nr:hypothetical protein CBR_g19799 [Chara braunii]|eukprot:GBG61267.1 hypothetical protein CBR_g19799 [Chara braunii]